MEQSREEESNANKALADLIKQVMHGRTAKAGHTRIVAGERKAAKKPDITITATGRSPVIIEAEYMPARDVEAEAKERLGYFIRNEQHSIEAVIALRYPDGFEFVKDIDKELAETEDLEYCAVYPQGKRFPTTGWLKGSVCDLADLIHLVDVPETAFEKCARDLENRINEAVSMFPPLKNLNEGPVHKIFKRLGLTEDPKAKQEKIPKRRSEKRTQVGRISGAIIANALLFQERIAAAYPDKEILHINDIRRGDDRKDKALVAWRKILKINYYPIFDAAIEIIESLSPFPAGEVLRILAGAAERIQEQGLLYENDLTGHVFQNLIVDRKYLAAFYTLPTSAALLARLAVNKIKDIDWSNADKIGELKIADFACGTGALLSAVYDQIANSYERHGHNPADLHKALMEDVFHGFDVVHYATCLTASILSGKQPGIDYKDTHFGTMPYGRQSDGNVKIGSLEFLDKSEQRIMFHTGDPAQQIHGQRTDRRRIEVLNNDLDLVIMNPPFTRNVTREGEYEGTFAAAFAAFGASDQDQRDMAKRMGLLKRGTCYHASAGMASAFAAIANKKLKPGGVLALVLPMTAAMGSSWQKLRTLLTKEYEDVEVISLADAKCYEVAFSAFTSMADCLVVARKKSASTPSRSDTPTRFVSLHQRPDKLAAAGETARELIAKKTRRKLEGGPFGGEEVFCGQEKMGETIQAKVSKTNPSWNPVRIRDYSLPQTAYKLTQSQLWLPGEAKPLPLPVIDLGNLAKTGYYHLQIINGPPNDAPFKRTAPSNTSTYPALWSHNAKQETKMICEPDCQLLVKPGMETQAPTVWRSAGHCHLTQDHTLTSQPLSVAFTKRKCIGGRAWVNINFAKKSWDYAFALWGNSTLGLLLFWWHGNRQQPGRARITITSARTLPILDFRELDKAQIQQAKAIFDQFKDKRLLPAYIADIDKTRAELDRAVLCDWLGFDNSTYQAVRQLPSKWCAEPSVHGGKQRNKNI